MNYQSEENFGPDYVDSAESSSSCAIPNVGSNTNGSVSVAGDEGVDSTCFFEDSGEALNETVGISDSEFLDVNRDVSRNEMLRVADGFQDARDVPGAEIPKMRVCVFGGLCVYLGEEQLPDGVWSKSKSKLMFAHLVTRFGREVSREVLMSCLWPDMDRKRALDNFYVTWAALRKTLKRGGSASYVIGHDSLYKIDSNLVESDIQDFDRITKEVLFKKCDRNRLDEMIVQLDTLYCGDILAGAQCDSYLERLRRRYKATFVDVLLLAADSMLKRGNTAGALWYSRRAFEVDSRREDVYQMLMISQGCSGQRSAAMETFFICKEYLDDELGISLSRKTLDIYDHLLNDDWPESLGGNSLV
ncbi:MAG: AfsR/SARP family transcriptional regulator [Coriobacteriales bacterium]|jgi:two-component SAPR family response regulator